MVATQPPTSTRPALTIEAAELRLVRLPLVTPFTIATGTMHEKLFPLIRLFSGTLEGVAEGVMDPLPDYLEETVAGAVDFLSTVILPGLVGQSAGRCAPSVAMAGQPHGAGNR